MKNLELILEIKELVRKTGTVNLLKSGIDRPVYKNIGLIETIDIKGITVSFNNSLRHFHYERLNESLYNVLSILKTKNN